MNENKNETPEQKAKRESIDRVISDIDSSSTAMFFLICFVLMIVLFSCDRMMMK